MFRKWVRFLCAMAHLLVQMLFSFNREKMVVCQGSKINGSIIISSCGSKRRMRFNNLSSGAQAEIDLRRIDSPSHQYIQLMIIAFIYYPFDLKEKNLLILGLGGGILPRAIRKIHPNSFITIVEIDPLVLEMAKKYFYFEEDSKMKVKISDGKFYFNGLPVNEYYHLMFVDIYDSCSSIPHHIRSEEFFLLLKSHLHPNGAFLVFNLVCIYQSYLAIQKLLHKIFRSNHFLTFRSNDFLNIVWIISTFPYSPGNSSHLNSNVHLINAMNEKLSIDFHSLLKRKEEGNFGDDSPNDYSQDQLENEENISLKQFIHLV